MRRARGEREERQLARAARRPASCATPATGGRTLRPEPRTLPSNPQAPALLRASAPQWSSPPLSVLSVFSVVQIPLFSLSRPFRPVPEPFQRTFGRSQRLIVSINGLVWRLKGVLGTSKHLFFSSKDVFGSSKHLMGSSRDFFGSSKDIIDSFKHLFVSSEEAPGSSGEVSEPSGGMLGSFGHVSGVSGTMSGSSEQVFGSFRDVSAASKQVSGSSGEPSEPCGEVSA